MDDGYAEDELTADECVRAGMYWFGRSDFEAAESWWNKALELEPGNHRARECLQLLHQTSATGFKSATWATPDLDADRSPFENPLEPEASRRPYLESSIGLPAAPPPPASPEGVEDEPVSLDLSPPRSTAGAWTSPRSVPGSGRTFEVSSPVVTTDPLDFASEGARYSQPSEPTSPTPWDDGPARTSVVTVEPDDNAFDAVPEPTPLPELDRDEYFERYPRSREEIVHYLQATGDLPPEIGDSDDVLDVDEPLSDAVPSEDSSDPIQIARNKFQLHDFDGVVNLLEGLHSEHPASSEAASLLAEARAQLLKMYESKLGDLHQTPHVVLEGEEVIWLNLNHRAGFILSQIDGSVTFDDLLSLSGMSRLDTVRILSELLAQRVIAV